MYSVGDGNLRQDNRSGEIFVIGQSKTKSVFNCWAGLLDLKLAFFDLQVFHCIKLDTFLWLVRANYEYFSPILGIILIVPLNNRC